MMRWLHLSKARWYSFSTKKISNPKDPKQLLDSSCPGKSIFDLDINIPDSGFLSRAQGSEVPVVDQEKQTPLNKRFNCPSCQKKVKFYCYNCRLIVGPAAGLIPKVELPLPLDIIKHIKENDSQSTGIHAKLIAPNSTNIINYPLSENYYSEPEKCLFLFPSSDAVSIKEAMDTDGYDHFQRVVVIEGTWYQARQMVRDTPSLKAMKAITFSQAYQTVFWRFQKFDSTHLATIEAIYFFYRELEECLPPRHKSSELGALLFYYRHLHRLIQEIDRKAS
ncbi:hypothetical protein DSO57_1011966 [Entomophthora muscae]|uniref:Uncharacterized protein n=1 Tax=Entomophthora muscae TaxID=34485 RepID=A0ACC2SVA6_9FUNG|nr:hypothetical protein DSO57_1011966 [Entomophthora muscae]